jgi:hypothetical protein
MGLTDLSTDQIGTGHGHGSGLTRTGFFKTLLSVQSLFIYFFIAYIYDLSTKQLGLALVESETGLWWYQPPSLVSTTVLNSELSQVFVRSHM